MLLADLWSGEKTSCLVDGKKILLVNIEDKIYAYEDRCAHQGVALSEGRLEGETLTCRAHHWEYDVCTGKGINPKSARLSGVSVKVQDGDILVDAGS